MGFPIVKFYLPALLLASLAACATVEARLPHIDASLLEAETISQEKQSFEKYKQQLIRLDRVSARILFANADLCPRKKADFGVITHSLKSYPKKLRAAAARQLGAAQEPVVLYVRPEGAADKLGVTSGDKFTSPLGKVISAEKIVSGTEFGAGGKYLSPDAGAPESCGYNVRLKFSGAVNAYATGKTIIVTTSMMEFVKSDEELALIVGHELAHNTMAHVRKSIQNAILSGLAYRTIRPFESEADYLGVYFAARAGFDMHGVEGFWRRLGVKNPQAIVFAKSHPITPKRLLAIKAAVKEIDIKKKHGDPIIPNFKTEGSD